MMTYNKHDKGSTADNLPDPLDVSDDTLDEYISGLYNEGRDLFARHLPLDAGLNAIVSITDNSETNEGLRNRTTLDYLDYPPESEGWFKADSSQDVDACVEVRFAQDLARRLNEIEAHFERTTTDAETKASAIHQGGRNEGGSRSRRRRNQGRAHHRRHAPPRGNQG